MVGFVTADPFNMVDQLTRASQATKRRSASGDSDSSDSESDSESATGTSSGSESDSESESATDDDAQGPHGHIDDAAAATEAVVGRMATHLMVWYIKAFDGSWSIPVSAQLTKDTGDCKALAMVTTALKILGDLKIVNVRCHVVVADNHATNVVSTTSNNLLVCHWQPECHYQ